MKWWSFLSGVDKIFGYLAIPFTVLFCIQMILIIIGSGGTEGDIELDHFEVNTEDNMLIPLNFRIFTIKNIITFFTIFSWGGIVGVYNGCSTLKAALIGTSLGVAVVAFLSIIYSFLLRASQSGTMNLNNAINCEGDVYLKVPQKGEGTGIVHLIIQGSLREVEAISLNKEIQTGEKIRVVGITEDKKLIIEPLDIERIYLKDI